MSVLARLYIENKAQAEIIQTLEAVKAQAETLDENVLPYDFQTQRMFDAWLNSLEGSSCDVVFYGDSITYYGEWKTLIPEYEVCNLGVGSDTVEGLIYRLPLIESLDPDKVFLMVGVNNISKGDEIEYIIEKYATLVEQLKSLKVEIYIQSVLPVREPSQVDNSCIKNFNSELKRLAEREGCTFIDLHSRFIDENGEIKQEYVSNDGIHLAPEAYRIWLHEIEIFI